MNGVDEGVSLTIGGAVVGGRGLGALSPNAPANGEGRGVKRVGAGVGVGEGGFNSTLSPNAPENGEGRDVKVGAGIGVGAGEFNCTLSALCANGIEASPAGSGVDSGIHRGFVSSITPVSPESWLPDIF